MAIDDKISGRIKKAASDLLGHEDPKGRGAHEERKAAAAALSDFSSREELYEEARRLGVKGRANMSKEELAAEITARK